MNTAPGPRFPAVLSILFLLNLATSGFSQAPAEGTRDETPASIETIETPDGRAIRGRLIGDAASGFRFSPEGGGEAIPLEKEKAV